MHSRPGDREAAAERIGRTDHRHRGWLRHHLHILQIPHPALPPLPHDHVRRDGPVGCVPGVSWAGAVRGEAYGAADRAAVGGAAGLPVHVRCVSICCECCSILLPDDPQPRRLTRPDTDRSGSPRGSCQVRSTSGAIRTRSSTSWWWWRRQRI